jgi:hypothetical protein
VRPQHRQLLRRVRAAYDPALQMLDIVVKAAIKYLPGMVMKFGLPQAKEGSAEASTAADEIDKHATKKLFPNEGLCRLSGELLRHVWSTVGGRGGAFSLRDR